MGQHPPTGWKGYFIGRIMQTDEWQYQFLAETGTGITRQQQYNQNYSNQGREKVIGYTISFTKGEPITIYHGEKR